MKPLVRLVLLTAVLGFPGIVDAASATGQWTLYLVVSPGQIQSLRIYPATTQPDPLTACQNDMASAAHGENREAIAVAAGNSAEFISLMCLPTQ